MNNMCVLDNWVGYDYKSIALPAELQGLLFLCLIFIRIGQLNQYINDPVTTFTTTAV